MKPFFKLSLVLATALLINTAHSQNKTIFIPPGLKINNGLNFASKKGKVSFFVIGENGKKTGLIAKNDKGNPVTLYFSSAAKINNSTGQTNYSTCKICYDILDDDGEVVSTTCEEVDCADLIGLGKSTPNTIAAANFPTKAIAGSYKIFQGDGVELYATYKQNILTGYSAKSTTGGVVYVNHITVQNSNLEVRCKIVVTTVSTDGKTIREVIRNVPCDKLPKKKTVTSS